MSVRALFHSRRYPTKCRANKFALIVNDTSTSLTAQIAVFQFDTAPFPPLERFRARLRSHKDPGMDTV